MCKFCDLLKNGGDMIWEERSTFADDNLCEFASVGGEQVSENVEEFNENDFRYSIK